MDILHAIELLTYNDDLPVDFDEAETQSVQTEPVPLEETDSVKDDSDTESVPPEDVEILPDDFYRVFQPECRHITSSGLVFTPLRELIWETPEYRRRPGDTWAIVARKKYRGDLTHYEKVEILSYGNHVYYVGDGEVKDVELHKNQCFADDQGFYLATRPRDHLIYRFEFNAFLAAGTFSEVFQCWDHKLGVSVAVKILRADLVTKHYGLREIQVMGKLSKLDKKKRAKTVQILGCFTFRDHICIVMELVPGLNLYRHLKLGHYQGFNETRAKDITKEILRCLKVLHDNDIVHADLKPENIIAIMAEDAIQLKLLDFGCSTFLSEQLYTYVTSRYYRAPEVILGLKWGTAIDIWSLGCIVGELLTGQPMFPGRDEEECLTMILELCGYPARKLILNSFMSSHYINQLGHPRYCSLTTDQRVVLAEGVPKTKHTWLHPMPGVKTIAQKIQLRQQHALNFVGRCLEFDPNKRMTVKEALSHPWLQIAQKPRQRRH